MGKTALLFSGQGSQYKEMGKDLCEKYGIIQDTYRKASTVFGFDLLLESISGEHFSQTGYAQPCVFILSCSILTYLKSIHYKYDGVAGFSLGECTALYGSGITSLEDTLKIVKYRSQAMEQAAQEGNGAMSAVLGLCDTKIEAVLSALDGFCIPVNYNCDGQTVIAGDKPTIEKAEIALKEAGAKRCMRLAVSSAFHTRYMDKAAAFLCGNMNDIPYKAPEVDFYTNLNGQKLDWVQLSEHLKEQMTSPVYFKNQIESMIKDGYDTFIEIGPGKVLSGFVKRINKDVKIMNIENVETLESVVQE